MRIHVGGCRGSTPASGSSFARYGGHTSCVAIARPGEPARLVLDAGTGLCRLSPFLADGVFRGVILLSHLHWDHTHGPPFFSAGDDPAAEVDLRVPAQPGAENPEGLLARVFSPHTSRSARASCAERGGST